MTARQSIAHADLALARRVGGAGRGVSVLGGLAAAVGTLLPWTYDPSFGGDLTYSLYPGGIQWWTLVVGVATALGAALARSGSPRAGWAGGAARAGAVWGVVLVALAVAEITRTLGGTVNVAPGAWLSLVGALVALIGSRALPRAPLAGSVEADRLLAAGRRVPAPLGIGVVVVTVAMGLLAAVVLLNEVDPVRFVAFGLFLGAVVTVLHRAGIVGWTGAQTRRFGAVFAVAGFLAAVAFPFTQNGSDANMSIAVQVLIFSAAAIGLNIVIGYAGLLDLGYIAFVGAGAYTSAILSGSIFATVGWRPPFAVVMLLGAAVSALLGLIIGLPTLRLRGDYLAIVTLAFGEIFRITVNNLGGENGPNVTGGPNGIAAIPGLDFGGFAFDSSHVVLGVTLGSFSNYYLLLLVLVAAIVFAVSRVAQSRIGRGWVAIREDETAAEAMGINTFRLKLLAFSGGALLAGLGGTIKAHADTSSVPDNYQFLYSSFLVAAIVLGGMGNIAGVILGSTILILLPEKLRFFQDNRLLLFGLLLVLMMRFRPEGLLPSSRRKLELRTDEQPGELGAPGALGAPRPTPGAAT